MYAKLGLQSFQNVDQQSNEKSTVTEFPSELHPAMLNCVYMLAATLSAHVQRTHIIDNDLDHVVAICKDALSTLTEDHPFLREYTTWYGSLLLTRSDGINSEADLNNAIDI